MTPPVRSAAPFVSALLLVAAVVLTGIQTRTALSGEFRFDFLGHNAARYAQCGRNFAKNGFTATGLAPDMTPGDPGDRPRMLYLHHPPLAPWLVGVSFALFGESEKNATLPFYGLGLLVPVLVFLVGRRTLSGIGPGAAALIAAAAPMTGFYGAHVDPQGPVLVAPLLLMTIAALFVRARRRGAMPRLCIATAVALLADWPAVYFALFLPLADRFRGGSVLGRRAWAPAVISALFLLAFYAWIVALGRSPMEEWISSATVRLASGIDAGGAHELGSAALAALVSFEKLTPWPIVLLALLAFVPGMLQRSEDAARRTRLDVTLWIWFGVGLGHVLLFPQGALIHDYWTFLLLPPLAFAGAAVLESARARVEAKAGDGFAFAVSCGVLVVLAVLGYRATERLYVERCDEWPSRLGHALREMTRPQQSVMTNGPYNTVSTQLLAKPEFTWASDRRVRGGVTTAEQLAAAQREEGPFDAYFYLTTNPPPPVVKELLSDAPSRTINIDGFKAVLFELKK